MNPSSGAYDRFHDLPERGIQDAGHRPDDPGVLPAHSCKTPDQIHGSSDRPINAVVLSGLFVEPGIVAFLQQSVLSALSDACEDDQLDADSTHDQEQYCADQREKVTVVSIIRRIDCKHGYC